MPHASSKKKEKKKPALPTTPPVAAGSTAGIRTMAVDIGGSGVKAMLLDEAGKPLTERLARANSRPVHAQSDHQDHRGFWQAVGRI